MITSTKNQQIRTVIELKKKAKARNESGLFAVEGIRMAAELPKERIEQVYVSESFLKHSEHSSVLDRLSSFETVSDSVFSAMSDTKTPQGILALVKKREYTLEEMLAGGQTPFLMLLENLQDPGNLGTILRAGEGAGITGVIMNRETADIFNPKVIRSTMGSIYRVPFVYVDDLGEAAEMAKARKIRLFAAHLKGKNSYDREDYRGGCGFLIGNEARGLTDETAALADCWVKIPMLGKVESLNAAVAASVLMFEAARQRRDGESARSE